MILKFFPKGAFQNPPFSPGRDHKRFSGPIVSISIIPDEARRKTSKNDEYESPEPTSPKVSCMGQIKHKKIMSRSKSREIRDLDKSISSPKKRSSAIKRMFSISKPVRKPGSASGEIKDSVIDKTPVLGQMKRFASGRDSLAGFDWKAQVAPVEGDHIRNYFSDEDGGGYSDGEEEEDVIIPFSAPMVMGGGGVPLRPRKEINLWKRRTMNPPRPLRLNS